MFYDILMTCAPFYASWLRVREYYTDILYTLLKDTRQNEISFIVYLVSLRIQFQIFYRETTTDEIQLIVVILPVT